MECFDVPAPGVGAVCGPCETGFTGDGVKCAGISIGMCIIIIVIRTYPEQKIIIKIVTL